MDISYKDIIFRINLKIKELSELENDILENHILNLDADASEEEKEKYLYRNNI